MKLFKQLLVVTLCALIATTSVVPAYSTTPPDQFGEGPIGGNTAGGSGDISSLGDKAVGLINEGTSEMTQLCLALFPLSLLILLALIIFCRNDKKMAGYIYFCGVVCVATLVVLLIDSGSVIELLESLANSISS